MAAAVSISAPAAAGIRRGLLEAGICQPRAYAGEPEAASTGVLVLDTCGRVDLVTSVARSHLELLGSGSEQPLPQAVQAVAAATRADLQRSPTSSSPGHQVRARTIDGGWTVIHAAPAQHGYSDARVVVTLTPARPDDQARLLLRAFGLTPREREIVALVARGLTTAEIASRLVLSPLTVQDHLKSVFDKTGVRTRRALVAVVFFNDYRPYISDHVQSL